MRNSLPPRCSGRGLRAATLLWILAVASPPASGQAPGTDIFVATISGPPTQPVFDGWVNVTRRAGYDNQPSFTPDSRHLLYASDRGGQTDIYRWAVGGPAPSALTGSVESEYSPTVMPGGDRFSVIRVEADSTQRLWSFDLEGGDPRLVLPDIAPVGYHAWLTADTVALFVLGAPSTLHIAARGPGPGRVVAHDIGRSLHRVPARTAVSFLHRDGGARRIRAYDPATGGARDLAAPFDDGADYAWLPAGVLVWGSGSRLYVLDPLTDSDWRLAGDLEGSGIGGITRIAVSPDGRHIAVVGEDATLP